MRTGGILLGAAALAALAYAAMGSSSNASPSPSPSPGPAPSPPKGGVGFWKQVTNGIAAGYATRVSLPLPNGATDASTIAALRQVIAPFVTDPNAIQFYTTGNMLPPDWDASDAPLPSRVRCQFTTAVASNYPVTGATVWQYVIT